MASKLTTIVYSYNKRGWEGDRIAEEIQACSDCDFRFIPFNHDPFLDPHAYWDAWSLDKLYRSRNVGLLAMYDEIERVLNANRADALFVTNEPPYHPDFLRRLKVYKVLYSTDDPDATYRRNIPYLHAYNHVMFVDPAYNAEMDMAEKMKYAGMQNVTFLPMGFFNFEHDPDKTESDILAHPRDIAVIYVGQHYGQKLPLLSFLKKRLRGKMVQRGFFSWRNNLSYNIRHGFPGWVRSVSHQERVRLYQRSKIGVNIHWSEFGLGNQRLYHLAANGVMQICDCPRYLGLIYRVGDEVVSYDGGKDLLEKVRYYLEHREAREKIALAGFRRAKACYRFETVTREAARQIRSGMERRNGPK